MELIRWWLILELMGLIAAPILAWLFPGLRDRGISMCRIVGLALVSYPVWLVSHWGQVFGTGIIVFFMFLAALMSGAILYADRESWRALLAKRDTANSDGAEENPSFFKEFLLSEIVFNLAFLALALIRAFNPEIEGMWKGGGSEKFMDLNFVNSILNSAQFPPQDNWLAGYPINYYYYGYYLAALLIKLTGVLPHVGYNLMVVTVYALAIQGLWGLLRNLGCRGTFALLGIYLAFFATNLKAANVSPEAGDNFIPWASSRVIDLPTDRTINEFPWFTYLWGDLHGHLSALPLQTAILGLCWGAAASNLLVGPLRKVLSAMLMALVYGCLVVTNAWDLPAFALILLASIKAIYSVEESMKGMLYAGGFFIAAMALLGLSKIGLPFGLLVLMVFILGAFILLASRQRPEFEFGGLLLLRLAAIASVFACLFSPFFSTFVPPTSGYNIVPWAVKTQIQHLFTIFGAPLAMMLIPLAMIVIPWVMSALRGQTIPFASPAHAGKQPQTEPVDGNFLVKSFMLTQTVVLIVVWAGAIFFLRSKIGSTAGTLTPALLLTLLLAGYLWAMRAWQTVDFKVGSSERYLALVFILGCGLVLGCEFVAVKDFYGEDSMRLNTVFKFHMQAWILFAIVVACLSDRFMGSLQNVFMIPKENLGLWGARVAQLIVIAAFTCWTLIGCWRVMDAKCSNFENSPTLNGLAYALPPPGSERNAGSREMTRSDAEAILWLLDLQRFEPDPQRLILESPGNPYSIFGRVSAFTGIPTLAAVPNHESIWNRGRQDVLDAMTQRQREAEMIYRTPDFRKSRELLDKHKVTLVFWGAAEKEKYGAQSGRKFSKYMNEAKSFGETVIYAGYKDIPVEDKPPLQELPAQPIPVARVIADAAHILDQPRGMTVGRDGNIYIANSKEGLVDCFSPEGGWLRSYGKPGQTANTGELSPEYSGVGSVAVFEDGSVYVADTWNHRIAVFNPDGSYQREIKADFWGPRNAAFYRGNLVVADTGKHRLAVLSREGGFIREVGAKGEGSGEFVEPVGLAVLNDQLLVADVGNHRIQFFNSDFMPVQEFDVLGWEDQVGTEAYLAVDAQQTIWLTDSIKSRVQRYAPDGKLLAIYGPETSDGPLSMAKGIAASPAGIILSDFGNNRLLIWQPPQK